MTINVKITLSTSWKSLLKVLIINCSQGCPFESVVIIIAFVLLLWVLQKIKPVESDKKVSLFQFCLGGVSIALGASLDDVSITFDGVSITVGVSITFGMKPRDE